VASDRLRVNNFRKPKHLIKTNNTLEHEQQRRAMAEAAVTCL